jgi:hypothetical protein
VRIPNAERAIVDVAKLSKYCLSVEHPRGRHKARDFASALGYTAADAEDLKGLLLSAILGDGAVAAEQDRHGLRYNIDIVASGPAGAATIRSSWIVRANEDVPRFVTCFVL